VDDDLATGEDTPLDFTGAELLTNDSDPDGALPAVDSVDTPSTQGGTITDLGGDNYQYDPPADFNGVDTFTYTIIDGALATDVGTVSVTVGDINDPPEVTDPSDQMDDEGDSPTLQIEATDMDGDTLTYSATGLPPELSIDPNTGLIGGTITQTANDGSPYAVTVTVTDGTTSVDVLFNWTVDRVNIAPELTQPADRSDLEGDSVTLPILATDVDGDVLEYSALGLPPGLSIDPDIGVITGDIEDGATAGSPYTVTITVTEVGTPEVLFAEVTFTWIVTKFMSVYLPLVMNAP
jgi:large repetitive protein